MQAKKEGRTLSQETNPDAPQGVQTEINQKQGAIRAKPSPQSKQYDKHYEQVYNLVNLGGMDGYPQRRVALRVSIDYTGEQVSLRSITAAIQGAAYPA